MKISDKGLDIIKQFESLKLKAYKDAVGIWTIGWGTIRYPSGEKVKEGQQITYEAAEGYLKYDVSLKTKLVSALLSGVSLNQNQIDAIISFTYNVGVGALTRSTLLKKVKQNPSDPSIELEFLKWNKAGGKVLNGLTKRRQAESDLYFS